MICNVCGHCTRCNRFVGFPCCSHVHHHCSNLWWNGWQYVAPSWNANNTYVHTHSHVHAHHGHHHIHALPGRHDAGSAISALAGRKGH